MIIGIQAVLRIYACLITKSMPNCPKEYRLGLPLRPVQALLMYSTKTMTGCPNDIGLVYN